MTARQAGALIRKELATRKIPCSKVTGMTVDFTDLARTSKIFVTIYGWKPNPAVAELMQLGKKNGFLVDFVY